MTHGHSPSATRAIRADLYGSKCGEHALYVSVSEEQRDYFRYYYKTNAMDKLCCSEAYLFMPQKLASYFSGVVHGCQRQVRRKQTLRQPPPGALQTDNNKRKFHNDLEEWLALL